MSKIRDIFESKNLHDGSLYSDWGGYRDEHIKIKFEGFVLGCNHMCDIVLETTRDEKTNDEY